MLDCQQQSTKIKSDIIRFLFFFADIGLISNIKIRFEQPQFETSEASFSFFHMETNQHYWRLQKQSGKEREREKKKCIFCKSRWAKPHRSFQSAPGSPFLNDSQTDSRLARPLSIPANENYNMWASSWPASDTAILMAEGSRCINVSLTRKANRGKKNSYLCGYPDCGSENTAEPFSIKSCSINWIGGCATMPV